MARSPLWDAVAQGHTAALTALLAAGADVNTRDAEGRTLLMHAAAGGRRWRRTPTGGHGICQPYVYLEVVEILLAAGGDVTAQDAQGKTALGYARDAGHPAVVARLQAAGALA
ncbi:MAG TPA: ankyrin repeat domain-containing protein [Chloroflexia bacterium]|nr:ankyrin repeat domain-containing protein [Chloroflexia bacterium]